MMGSMDFWIIGSSVTLVAQGVWNQVLLPFPAFLLSLWSFWPRKVGLPRKGGQMR